MMKKQSADVGMMPSSTLSNESVRSNAVARINGPLAVPYMIAVCYEGMLGCCRRSLTGEDKPLDGAE